MFCLLLSTTLMHISTSEQLLRNTFSTAKPTTLYHNSGRCHSYILLVHICKHTDIQTYTFAYVSNHSCSVCDRIACTPCIPICMCMYEYAYVCVSVCATAFLLRKGSFMVL